MQMLKTLNSSRNIPRGRFTLLPVEETDAGSEAILHLAGVLEETGVRVTVLLVDGRPEDAALYRRLPNVVVIATPFDATYREQAFTMAWELRAARHRAMQGTQEIVLIDSLSRLHRALIENLTEDPTGQLIEMLDWSGNTGDGGCLTIIGTALPSFAQLLFSHLNKSHVLARAAYKIPTGLQHFRNRYAHGAF